MSKPFKSFLTVLVILLLGFAATVASGWYSSVGYTDFDAPNAPLISNALCSGVNMVSPADAACEQTPIKSESGLPLHYFNSLHGSLMEYLKGNVPSSNFKLDYFVIDWIIWSTAAGGLAFGIVKLRQRHAHNRH